MAGNHLETIKIMIFGATGMLGHKLAQYLGSKMNYEVYPVTRNGRKLSRWLPEEVAQRIIDKVDVKNFDEVSRVITEVKPTVVINCIGIIKQLPAAKDPLETISLNALFPHRLARICTEAGARMIHISTDCVFDGIKGNYRESDIPNPPDLYGRTKLLGEVEYPHCLTLRTSIIGHEIREGIGLIDWFLRQEGNIRGFTRAIYSGLPTIELARVIHDYVMNRADLQGLFHVSADPISKYELLNLVASQYNKQIRIEPDGEVCANKSLNSGRFRTLTGYVPPAWPELIEVMHKDYLLYPYSNSQIGASRG